MPQTADSVTAAAARAGMDIKSAFGDAWQRATGWVEGIIHSLPNVIAAVVVLIIFWWLGRLTRKVTARIARRVADQPEINRLVAATAEVLVIGLGLVLALGVLNLDKTVTSLLAGAGIIGLALGFAFQNIAENFIAGVILNIRNQFTEGDIIETNDYMGVVERVDLRATRIRTFPGQRVLIPNAQVFKNPLVNYSQGSSRRVDLTVGVSYGDDLTRAAEVAAGAVADVEGRDPDRDVEVYYQEFGNSSINFQLRFWIPFHSQIDYVRARSDAIIRIKAAFDANDITIPFPIRTLDFGIVGGQTFAESAREAGLGRAGAAGDGGNGTGTGTGTGTGEEAG